LHLAVVHLVYIRWCFAQKVAEESAEGKVDNRDESSHVAEKPSSDVDADSGDEDDNQTLSKSHGISKKAEWAAISLGDEVRSSFWSEVESKMLPPRREEAIHPFRKLYAKFQAPHPNKVKLAAYLVFLALDHPMMLFYGLGIFGAKKMATHLDEPPSVKLLETCKTCFVNLQQSYPQLFGTSPKTFASAQVANFIKHVFRKPSTVKAKGTAAADQVKVDEPYILSCIAGYVDYHVFVFFN
jgi:hypothetical protein